MGWFKGIMGQLSLEYPVRNKNISDLAAHLEISGNDIIEYIASAQIDSDENQAKMRHIIGIERWGQRRLRGFLGDIPPDEEYDAYCPESGYSLKEQLELFRDARAKTVYLAIQIEAAFVNAAMAIGMPTDNGAESEAMDESDQRMAKKHEIVRSVEHNEYGPLTPRGWLRYLEMHARMESKSIA